MVSRFPLSRRTARSLCPCFSISFAVFAAFFAPAWLSYVSIRSVEFCGKVFVKARKASISVLWSMM